MPTFYSDVRLLDPTGNFYLYSFKVDFGAGVTLYQPDWDVDPTFENVDQHGTFTIDQFGPYSIFQEAETANNPGTGSSIVYASFSEITLARIDNPNVRKTYTLSPTLDCILDAPVSPGDIVAPFVVVFSPVGTSVSPATPMTLSWSENITPVATKTMRLVDADTIGGTLDVIETFTVATAPTSGPGSIAISNVTMVVTPTNQYADGKRLALLIDGGAYEDAAGNPNPAIADDTYSFTVAAVAPPPPVTGDIIVGSQTPAGVKVHPATSYTGSDHFALSGGFIVTTSTGAAAGYNGSPYSVTLDGQSIEIATVANGISFDSIASAHTARDTAQASPSTDWTLILCSGIDFGNTLTWNASTAAMNGTYSHPDFTGFTCNKTADNYTVDAETTVSGGSITYKPSGSQTGIISSYVNVHSNGRTFFDGRWNFAMFATQRGWSVIENGPQWNGYPTVTAPFRTIYQFNAGSGGGSPTGCLVFKNGVDFGIAKLALDPGFATSIILTNNLGYFSCEKGCRADGFIIWGGLNAVRAYNIEDMEWRQSAEDAMRCFGVKALGGTELSRRVVRNTLHEVYGYNGAVEVDGGITWLGFHADFMQDRFNDQVPIGGICADNLIEQTTDNLNIDQRIDAYFDGTNGKPDLRGVADKTNPSAPWLLVKGRGTQGRIINNSAGGGPCTTQFRRMVFLGNTANAWQTASGDAGVDMALYLQVHDMHVAPSSAWNYSSSGVPWGSHLVYRTIIKNAALYADLVGTQISADSNVAASSVFTTLANNATAANSPKQIFNGTDGNGGGFDAISFTGRSGGTYSGLAITGLDHSSVAALRADVAARFTPRTGSILAGKVFLNP